MAAFMKMGMQFEPLPNWRSNGRVENPMVPFRIAARADQGGTIYSCSPADVLRPHSRAGTLYPARRRTPGSIKTAATSGQIR